VNEYSSGKDMLLEEKDDRLKKVRAELTRLRQQKAKLLAALNLAKEARAKFNRYGFYGKAQIQDIFEPMDLAINDCEGIQ